MRIFLSYKFTGVPLKQLHSMIDPIKDKVESMDHELVCNLYYEKFYQENKYSVKETMLHALTLLESCDAFMILHNGEVGEGMGIEFGYAMKKCLPIVLLLKSGMKSVSMRALAHRVIEFDDWNDLMKKLKV